MTSKVVLFVDGLGDVPIKSLGWQTPLEVSYTPNLDKLASVGMSGLVQPPLISGHVSSFISLLSYLGYDVGNIQLSRAFLEATGADVKFNISSIGFVISFIGVNKEGFVVKRVPFVPEIVKLEEAINRAMAQCSLSSFLTFKMVSTQKAVIFFKKTGSDFNPLVNTPTAFELGEKIQKVIPLDREKSSILVAKILNDFSMLASKEIKQLMLSSKQDYRTVIFPWGQGRMSLLPSLEDRLGWKSTYIGGYGVVRGICKFIGMNVITFHRCLKDIQDSMIASREMWNELVLNSNFVLIWVNEVDIAGHSGNVNRKIESIETVDLLVGEIIQFLNDRCTFAVITDHCTRVETSSHSTDAVPATVYYPNISSDKVQKFSEKHCAEGKIGSVDSRSFLIHYLC